jgi:hypothetical protein
MLLRLTVAATAIAFAVTSAFGDDLGGANAQGAAPAAAAKPHRTAKKPSAAAPDAASADLDQIQFSQPNASPLAGQKPAKTTPEKRTDGVSSEPAGGVSLDFKWRATNDRTDPFDAVRHTSGPNGPGDAVQGGIKVGF